MTLQSKNQKRETILEYIENNSTKSELIHWLNSQHDVAFSEDSSWQDIQSRLLDPEQKPAQEVSTSNLQVYAASLSSEEDIKNLLQNVEEETKKAKQTAHKLTYLSQFKKFAVSLGGAVFLEGLIFLIFAFGLSLNLISFSTPIGGLDLYTGIIAGILGITNTIAGLLLATR